MKQNNETWMVFSNEEGIILITDDYDEAILTYESERDMVKEYCNQQLEYSGEENVILAKVSKQLCYSVMNEKELEELKKRTGEKLDEYCEYGNLYELEFKI